MGSPAPSQTACNTTSGSQAGSPDGAKRNPGAGIAEKSRIALRLLDLTKQGQCSFEFIIEQPHRIENLADRRRCFRPVGLAKSEDTVVAEISHDPRIGNPVAGQVAGLKRRAGWTGNDLNEFEQFHLIDRVRQRFRDHRYVRKKIGMGVGKAVSHRGPMIEPMIQSAGPRLFPVVTRVQGGIEGRDRPFHRRPFLLAILVFSRACL